MSTNTKSPGSGSYMESAKGAAQSVMGAITGNNQAGQPSSSTHHHPTTDPSHSSSSSSSSISKIGPLATSPTTGAISTDDPNRATGSYNQTIGSGKETLGNLLGAQDLKRSGAEQKRQGEGQEAQGQLSDFGSGIGDRVAGKVGMVGAVVMGDEEAERRERERHDVGKTLQGSAERGMERSAGR
ncbi:hypothetical protein MMC16_005854 [Acarospora aff. strigata]|nr:hypothetical protein [Acarospora aff. strigata]